jgi:diacylglycerol kinase (ATP)
VLPATLAAMREAVDESCASGADAVIACGGDGTVHQVLQAAVRHDVSMGVIAAGTGNDIARSLGIPVKDHRTWVDRLADLISAGQPRRVDLARITHDPHDVWSLGVISAGFDSAVNERADRMTHLRGTPRYVAALLAELRSFHMNDYLVTIDGQRHEGSALLIAIGNGQSYGGGMRICPAADMSDGILEVTWIDTAPRRTVLRFFPKIFSGRHIEHPLVRTYRGREITLQSTGPVIYADGERVGVPPVDIVIVPGALSVWCP